MELGPNNLTPGQLKDQLVGAHRSYREGKEKLIERSVTSIESGRSKILAPSFVIILVISWVAVFLWEPPIGEIFDMSGFLFVGLAFYASYFAFLHLSKLIFKPSREEAADDTSYLALFSACEARERRGLFSAAFGLANTVAILLYVILKQTGTEAWRFF